VAWRKRGNHRERAVGTNSKLSPEDGYTLEGTQDCTLIELPMATIGAEGKERGDLLRAGDAKQMTNQVQTEGGEREATSADPALAYARLLWANILDWYKNADLKAQVLLTFDGAFLSFLAGSVFVKAENLENILVGFGLETWGFALAMVLALLGSIISALACLRSRLEDPREIERHLREIVQDSDRALEQNPETMYFFGHIAQLADRNSFQQRMERFGPIDEVRALSGQIFLVSKNVLRKHQSVNHGFMLAGATLIFFLGAAISYVARIAI